MDFVLPSISAILLAVAIVMYVFPRIAPVMLAIFAAVALAYGIYTHYTMFGGEYMTMTWVDQARSAAPYIMVTMVVTFLIGYLLFIYGSMKSAAPSSWSNLPPASTATNSFTAAVNNSLNSAGFNSSRARNNLNRAI